MLETKTAAIFFIKLLISALGSCSIREKVITHSGEATQPPPVLDVDAALFSGARETSLGVVGDVGGVSWNKRTRNQLSPSHTAVYTGLRQVYD